MNPEFFHIFNSRLFSAACESYEVSRFCDKIIIFVLFFLSYFFFLICIILVFGKINETFGIKNRRKNCTSVRDP